MADPGTPIACRLVADCLQAAGLDRLITVDLHSAAIPGFFSIPVTEGRAIDLLADSFRSAEPVRHVVVAPDAGGIKRASRFATHLGLPLAFAMKHRPAADASKLLQFWGDVRGCEALIVDDMISTGGTIEQVAQRLWEEGATAIDLAVTHPIMAPGAEERLRSLGIRRMVVTDSVPYQPSAEWPALQIVTLAPLLADLVRGSSG
jgi:ribose-phosphate pyrophosphokinase